MLKSYLFKFLGVFAVCMTVSFGLMAQSNATVTVNGVDYAARLAAFGPAITDDVSAPVSYALDTSGLSTVCALIEMDLTGTIALVDRGACGFIVKAQNAQAAGAMGIIVCNNNQDLPHQAIVMGAGAVDPNSITVPTVMLSYAQCQTIRANDPGTVVTLSATVVPPGDAEVCSTATEITHGTYTVDSLTAGYGGALASTSNAKWYAYTPTANTLATVSSCGQATDTRVSILTGTDCSLTDALIVAQNDDCDPDNSVFSSEVSFAAQAGVRYWILWDDRWSDDGFEFTLSEGALPMVNITVSVDMSRETVAPEGVFLAGSHNGWTDGAMTDNGDGTWTGVITVTTLDTVQYKFKNGPNGWETGDLAACGVDDGFGNSNRAFVANTLEDAAIGLVCFNSCATCPPLESCPSWINEDFEGLALGGLSAQSEDWATWTPNSASEDAVVSNAFANSGSQSMLISAADPDDQLLLLGDRTEGNFILKWKIYVPAGSSAYYNIQKFQDSPGATGGFAMQATFNANGTGTVDAQGAGTGTFTYAQDAWVDVVHQIDLDNDHATLTIGGQLVREWAFSSTTGAAGTLAQLGSIDFFGNTGNLYYIDDVVLKQIEACPANALICDGADGYDLGTLGTQSGHWIPWSLNDGAGDDAEVVNSQFLSCEQSILVSEANGTDLLLQLGDKTEGNYALSWDFYIPTGATGYFNVQKVEAAPGQEFGTQVDLLADGSGLQDAGAADIVTFAFPHDTWFPVQLGYDLDNNIASLSIDGVTVNTWPANWTSFTQTGLQQLGAINFYGNVGTEQYIDNVLFVQLPSVVGDVCASANDISGLFGQGLNNIQTSSIYDNTGYSNAGDPTTGYECFGEPDGGASAPTLENTIWFSFVGDGQTYFIETVNCDGVTDYIDSGDTQIAVYSGACGALTPVACNEDGPNATATEYPAAVELATEAGVTYYMMIDGFDATAFGAGFSDGQFCISVNQLTAPAPVTMTVSVDMGLQTVSAEGVFIAGSFNEWPNPGTPMTDNGDGTWSVTVDVPANSTVEYKFQNGTDGWENIDLSEGDGCTLGNFGNRFVMTGTDNVVQDLVCFNYCVTCIEVDVIDPVFAAAIAVFPNPASSTTNIQYNFEKASDLTIRLTNTLGQTVQTALVKNATQGTHTMNVSNLAAGMYMLHITDGERAATQTLMID